MMSGKRLRHSLSDSLTPQEGLRWTRFVSHKSLLLMMMVSVTYLLIISLFSDSTLTVNIVLCTADLSNIKHDLCYLTTHRATYDVITTLLSEPGILQFQKPSYLYKESAGIAELIIERNDGCDGRITVQYKTKDITAVAGKDYDVSTIFSAAAFCFSFDEIWCFVVLLFTLF